MKRTDDDDENRTFKIPVLSAMISGTSSKMKNASSDLSVTYFHGDTLTTSDEEQQESSKDRRHRRHISKTRTSKHSMASPAAGDRESNDFSRFVKEDRMHKIKRLPPRSKTLASDSPRNKIKKIPTRYNSFGSTNGPS